MKLYIKYMVSLRCKMMVKEELHKLDPAIDVFQITAEIYTGEYVIVQVIDILGKIIKSEVLIEMPYKGIEINLHDQAEGIYLVNILKSGHEPLMKKVMIIHK